MKFQITKPLVLIGAARTGKTVLARKIAEARGAYQIVNRFSFYYTPNEIINTLILDDVKEWKYVLQFLQKKRFFYRDNSLLNKLRKMPRPPLIIITANELPKIEEDVRKLFDLIDFIGANTNIEVEGDSFNVPGELEINLPF